MSDTPPDNRRRNRLVFVAIAVLFVVPILAATYLNSTWTDWAPDMTKNNGELIQPVRRVDGASQRWEAESGGRWTVLAVSDGCDAACGEFMGVLANVHLALGRRGDRVRRELVTARQPSAPALPERLDTRVDGELSGRLEDTLGAASVYLVDPLGNVMMRYPEGFDPSGLRKDLERLLKYSKVGT